MQRTHTMRHSKTRMALQDRVDDMNMRNVPPLQIDVTRGMVDCLLVFVHSLLEMLGHSTLGED